MHRHALAVAGVLLISGTGCHMGLAMLVQGADSSKGPYQAGEIATELGPGAVRTLACLDVGFSLEVDRGPLLDAHVGNHCVHAEPFDLSRLVVRGKDGDGVEHLIHLVDPRQEIQRLHVGALERGRERIRLEGLESVISVCFDVTQVAPDAPQARPSPICLARTFEGWRVESS